jgi:hypothetical protein
MKVCNNCQQQNPVEAAFCRQCASPLGNQSYQAPPPPANQPGWNQPTPRNQQNFAMTTGGASQRAMLAAGLAAFGLCCCFPGGIVAAIVGWLEISAIKEGKSSSEGMMLAQIGMWGGIAGAIINAISYFILTVFGYFGGGY